MAILKPTEAALRVLKECTVEGNVVKLPPDQLERNLYQEVRKHLELIGGKWKGGKTYGFVFEDCETSYIQQLLNGQANGDGRNLKKEFQFFATPPELATRMAQLLSSSNTIPPLAKVLEPSAGDGALIKAVRKYYPSVESIDCFELMDINRIKLLKLPHTKLLGEDFLISVDVDSLSLIRGQYDYIIANPPFTNNQDIDHIRAMYRCLKTNGRLVTLASPSWTFGSQKKQVEFRQWLESIGAYQEEVPEGTFLDSGTNIRVILLVIDKLEPVEQFIPSGFEKIKDPIEVIGTLEISTTQPIKSNKHNMKKIITIPASPLMEVLKKVKEVISKHPTITTLSNILIKVRRTDIEIIATDLMVTIQAVIDVKNDGEFGYNYLLPFDYLYNIGTLINGLDLTVEIDTIEKKVDGKKVKITNAILTTFSDVFKQDDLDNPDDFPALPEFPQENSVGIGGDFIPWLNKAIDTVSSDNTNPAMQKIFVGVANEGLCMASTNAHVVFEKSFKAESQQTTDLLVNTKIAKALKGFKETSISWSETHIAFVSNGITMIGTIQAEKFPNYKGVFPLDPPANLRLSLAELTGVMDKAALTKKPATIFLKREIGHIVVESNDEIYNRKVTVRIGADYSGDCEQIIVDPEKMLLLLGQIEYTTITLSITGPDKPIIITSESDPTYRSLTMPLVN